MNTPLISVIVPVYKAEPYLLRCVQSIQNQTYRNLEIILVDDGSPDRCGQMCDAYAAEDPRIRVIHKENGGLSSARNAGLDIMTGEFVGFVDSDDWIEPDMYQKLYDLTVRYDAKIAACGIQCDAPDGSIISYFCSKTPLPKQTRVFTQPEALQELIRAKIITNSACDKLFAGSVFKQRRFKVGIVNEDFDLMPHCMASVDRLAYDSSPLYHYIMTAQSITRGVFKASRFTETDISRNHISFYQANYPQLQNAAIAKHIEISLVLIYDSAASSQFSDRRAELIREVRTMTSTEVFRLLDRNTKIKYLLFRINIGLFTRFMDFYYKRS